MSRFTFDQWTKQLFRRRKNNRNNRGQNRTRTFERLDERAVLSVTASFAVGSGVLSVFGDNLDNTIVVSRDAAGRVLVNGGAVSIVGGTPTVANTSLIQMFGQGGNDQLTLNEA